MCLVSRRVGFSLVEVVVAVGIFAIAIVSIIGLLVPINNSVADIRDTEDASRLSTVIQGELQKLSFDTLTLILNNPPTTDANRIFASRDGSIVEIGDPRGASPERLNVWDSAEWNGSINQIGSGNRTQAEEDALKFFKVELSRNTALSPNDATNPDSAAGYLAFTIKLSWPAFAPNGALVDPSQQSAMIIPAAITR